MRPPRLLFFPLVILAANCGQNAHVTRANRGGQAVQQKAPAQPAQEPVSVSAPMIVDGGSDANNGSDGADGIVFDGRLTPAPVLPAPEPAKIVEIIKGDDGKDGSNGRDGKDSCAVETRSDRMFDAHSPQTTKKLQAFAAARELPYKSTVGRKPSKGVKGSYGHTIKLLPIGGSTGINKAGERITVDAQTVFTIEVALPPAAAFRQLRRADLVLDIGKVKVNGPDDTELLCLLDERICSGKTFTDPRWFGNINEAFFSAQTYKAPVNSTFSDLLTDPVNKKWSGSTVWENNHLSLSFSDLLHGSQYAGDVAGFLYAGSGEAKLPYERTLNLVVSDDVYVKGAKVVLSYDEDTCVTGALRK